jgi:hypothetical protein
MRQAAAVQISCPRVNWRPRLRLGRAQLLNGFFAVRVGQRQKCERVENDGVAP